MIKFGSLNVKDIRIGETQVKKVAVGSEVIWEKSTSPLPSGYRQVEYLQSSGTQWINSNYYPNLDTLLEMKYRYIFENSGRMCWAFGSRNTTSSGGFGFILNYFGSTTDESISVFSDNTYPNNMFRENLRNQDIIVQQSKNGLYIDGIRKYNNRQTTFQCSYPCLLFWGSTEGTGDSGRLPYGRIYYCKIWESDVIQRDFIPCLDPNDRPCMFDLVTQQPFYNQGTGTFGYETMDGTFVAPT